MRKEYLVQRSILAQMRKEYGTEPDAAVACVGGGSNAIGTFYPLVAQGQTYLAFQVLMPLQISG